jgi:predicted acyl esterase
MKSLRARRDMLATINSWSHCDDQKSFNLHLLYAAVAMLLLANGVHAQQPAAKPALTLQEVMIPMRDGVRLQTVIIASSDQKAPLPILFRRTLTAYPRERRSNCRQITRSSSRTATST